MKNNFDHDFDIGDRIKASISSLKELVIIFTGLTITVAFSFFVRDHFIPAPGEADIASLELSRRFVEDAFLLMLLMLCVIRFYHGNIMIMDRYYLIPKENVGFGRDIAVDSTAIFAMTVGLALLGCLIHNYVWFFCIYLLITIISVIWSVQIAYQNMNKLHKGVPDELKDEYLTQMRWLLTNGFFLVVIFIILVFATKLSTNYIVVTRDDVWKITFERNDLMFWIISVLIFLNSTWDLWINRKEYFPRRVAP